MIVLEPPRWKQTLAAMRWLADKHPKKYALEISRWEERDVINFTLKQLALHPNGYWNWVAIENVTLGKQ